MHSIFKLDSATALYSLLLLATILPNLHRARTRWLRAYFWTQTVYTVVLWPIDPETVLYEATFSIFTFLILAASAGYVLECSRIVVWQVRIAVLLISLTLPVALYAFTINGLSSEMQTLPSYLAVSLAECCAIFALGICLSVFAPIVRGASIPLALLWLSLAAWEYAWTLGYPFYPETWMRLNSFVPTTLVVGFFIWAFFAGNSGERINNYASEYHIT